MDDSFQQNRTLNEVPLEIHKDSSQELDESLPIVLNNTEEELIVDQNDIMDMGAHGDSRHGNKTENLTMEQKNAVVQMLLQESEFRKKKRMPRRSVKKISDVLSISSRSIWHLWESMKCFQEDGMYPDFSSKLCKRVGRKRVEFDMELIKADPFRKRTNIKSLSSSMGISKSIINRRIKEGMIRPHSNSLKPLLSDENRITRLKFCLSMIDKSTVNDSPCFVDMYYCIHIDEKWFYISKVTQKYYLHPDESEPYRACKSKRFITKIMFLAAVAIPRVDKNSGMFFDGKKGIWPFVYKELVKRNSKNRVAGTMETKPVSSVTKEEIRSCLIQKLLPAIKEKWPYFITRKIFVQQDNAKPHLDVTNTEFNDATNTDGFEIELCCQPPNSPDMNVLDLGFFRANDSLQHQEAPTNIDEFISTVEKAYQVFLIEQLNNLFLTLESCMIEVMKANGGNHYKIPHMNKKKLLRSGQLPENVKCDKEVLIESTNFVSAVN